MVAVGGDSGTGKATLCAGLRAIFGEDRCTEVRLDGYFGLNRAQRYAVGITALDPRAHDFAAMDEGLQQLANGGSIVKPVYDHLLGSIATTETVEPRDIVLVQGLFPLYTRVLRALFDVSVWLEPDPELKLAWTIHRDITERGYREDQVRAELERRKADYEKYIAPQAEYADIRASFSRTGVTFHKSSRLSRWTITISPARRPGCGCSTTARVPTRAPSPKSTPASAMRTRARSPTRSGTGSATVMLPRGPRAWARIRPRTVRRSRRRSRSRSCSWRGGSRSSPTTSPGRSPSSRGHIPRPRAV